MQILISLIILAAIIVIFWFAAKAMYEIAVMKGHTDKKYFWWCFWVPGIGYLMVLILPDRIGLPVKSAHAADELPEL